MSDRLAELRRQRALIQEHLAWLEREIGAAEKGVGATPLATPISASIPLKIEPVSVEPRPTPALTAPQALPTLVRPSAVPKAEARDATLGQYRVSSAAVKDDVRKGCLMYFAGALVLLTLAVAALWFIFRRDEAELPPPEAPKQGRLMEPRWEMRAPRLEGVG